MYLLVCLAILGSAYGAAVPVVDVARTQPELYVLPNTTYPTFYDVTLFLDPGNPDGFSGSASIRIFSYIETDEIVLHAMALDITSIRITSDMDTTTDLYESLTLATDDTQLLKITVSQPLVPLVPYTIQFEYKGFYAENMFGIYVSTYEYEGQTRRLITSQLQPTFARRAFPCFDEPAYKAIFRTTIYAPPQYPVVRSNTNIRQTALKPEVPGYTKHEFDDTLVMSSYLIAYLVSDFPHIENTGANAIYRIPFRVYSRPGTQDAAEFALRFGQDNMVALERYTEFDYAFEKMDKAAVPDFAAGAMENWGLVIYREVALLVVDGVTTTATKQNIGRIICHENMHQWFGNEVSPTSWTYTWLNEGFANFFENFATDLSIDGWRMMDQFVIALQNVFQSDAVLSVNSMTHEVYTPSEILGTFNAVAYQKSGSVIRMMQHFLTPEVFRQGLAYYIRTNSRKAVTPVDLYDALQTVLDQSDHSIPYRIADVMNWWANQGGFPVLQVNRTAPAAASISVTQRRYLTDSSQTSDTRWLVPFNWVLSTNPDFSDTRPQQWLSRSTIAQSFTVQGLPQAEWYIVNKQQTGYYRVNYDIQNWAALARVMNDNHELIHLLNRAQLLDDAFNLARTGALNYRYPFELSRYLVKEKDYIPWAAVNPAFSYLDLALSGSEQYQLFQAYLLELTAPLYAELGFNVIPGEEHVAPYHRNIILDINCRHGNPECISTAAQMLANFKNNPSNPLNPDIQNLVYCSGLRGGDVDNFSFLWERYLASTDSSEQSILLGALGCTSNEERRTFYLNQIIDPNTLVRQQDRHSILVSVINSSPENMDAALDFVIEHWPAIQNNVQGLSGTNNILTAFSRRLTTQAHREKINEFSTRHSSVFTAAEAALVGAIEENIESSITWSNQNAAVVEEWLQENDGTAEPGEPVEPIEPVEPVDPEDSGEDGDGDGAASISASIILLVSVSIISVFNTT